MVIQGYKHQNWRVDSKQICPTSHLKIQDGGHFSRWPPPGARDNDIPHKLVSIQPILVIFASNGMF